MSTEQLPLALRCPLRGSRLIEASAGTGKTFTISALYLRLVLGLGNAADFPRELLPYQILVVTFTDAATQELRDRIRARLVEAAQAFRGELPEPDPIITSLRAQIPDAQWPSCARKLEIAAQWMDQAAVSTIHSWCQRMLREHAFDSGSLFEQSLETDQRELLAEVARDYWRLHCYPLQAQALAWVAQHWQHPDQLLQALRPLLGEQVTAGAEPGLQGLIDQALTEQARQLAELKVPWLAWADELEQLIEQGVTQKLVDGRKLQRRYYAPWFELVRQWASDPQQVELALPEAAWNRLSEEGLDEVWKQGAPPTHPALRQLPQLRQALAQLPGPQQPALRHAAAWVAVRFEAEKRRRAQMGFDDMLSRLDAALQGPNGARLAEVIRQQFPVALIDEFQDTDPLQYRIFDAIYRVAENDQDSALLLIGDPKQAIYAFRGADIFTYLQARSATAGRHENLDTNYRSSQNMVAAVNRVFSQAEANNPRGAFLFRRAADNPLPFLPVQAQGRSEQWTLEGHPAAALTAWYLPGETPISAESYRQSMAERCASAMVELLQAGQRGVAGFRRGETLVPVKPADMAVLVRTGREAQYIRQALAERGVRSVYLSDKDSVLDSLEARDLLRWLRACSEPGNDRLLRAALASPTLNLSWAELERLNQDERYWEQRVDQFRDYRRLWLRQGVLPMLHRLLHDFGLPARLLQLGDGERRLTNLLHLAELLQRAARELDGEQALIRHLAEQIQQPGASAADEQVLRLESDAELVKVVTIHKSKGLEYPLVFLPFIADCRPVDGRQPLRVHDGVRSQLVLEPDEETLRRADDERLGEDLRLLYVALTRARHACWLGLADLKKGQGKTSTLHRSAVAWLLAGGQPLPESAALPRWLAAWEQPGEIEVLPAPEPQAQVYQPPQPAQTELRERQPLHRRFQNWWIGSYSALVSGSEAPDSALSEHLGDDERSNRFVPLRPGETPTIHRFPRGPQPGTFIHGLLELAGREGFARLAEPARGYELLAARCQRRGWGEWSACLSDWLGQLLRHPGLLPDQPLALADLLPGTYQSELEFMFSAERVDARQIDALVCAETLDAQPRPQLAAERLNGLFKGFIDLVFEHQGRYWVLDYKSNWLGQGPADYTPAAMQRSILEHRYDLQYVFYLLALHRQLRARLPDYDYDRHVGGAIYWFVRGVEADSGGLWQAKPPRTLIETLDRLFAGQTLEAVDG
ncbi:exodeoxyribonuclease V subunit beta [Halopseudomonas phragmitis]|uniref:RecBCD enzyme subunit RecB n=1 Tax=Halopseudomonas phragmitis TaxID=1931241 RepID=A0A1V0B1A2_9GAMM|nr:exodeoxyribonuclease V subunit beta [Halopseudomonas phragmitis]AQZ93709.1 exodeoxyribonuclease V subunit beta [Halopseudomonas phragmitis]